jgi:hypothetical protein
MESLIMKNQIIVSTEQKNAEDQLRRGISIRVNFKHISAFSWGYAIGDKPIVQCMPSLSGNALIVELLDPNPEYAECGEPLQTIWIIDLTGELDLIEEIEAISDHLIDHQARHESPCENHPDERCGDCHLREVPCFECGTTIDTAKRWAPLVQSDLYMEVLSIMEATGMECLISGLLQSTWAWDGYMAVTVRQNVGYVEVEFEDWVIKLLLEVGGLRSACPIIRYQESGGFGLLCFQLVEAFTGYPEKPE